MPRLWERVYPYVISGVLLIVYMFYFSSILEPILQSNTSNIINSTITLSSIFLSFVGVMLGVLISIKNMPIINILKAQNALSDLMRYVKEACLFDFISLIMSITFLIIIPSNMHLTTWQIYILLLSLSIMILSSYRMISILFEIVNINEKEDSNNIWNKKKFTPKNI